MEKVLTGICVWKEGEKIVDTGWGKWNPLGTEVEMEFQGSLELINYYVKNLPFNQET